MYNKKKVCVISGGMSTEHDVSLVSGKNVIKNIDPLKYDVYSITIDKNGKWLNSENEQIKNLVDYLKSMDVVFPVLHGKYGEDGTVQGLLDLVKVPYVGCGVLSSSVSMDKVYTKIIFEKAKIPQAEYIYLKNENTYVDENFDEIELNNSEIVELVKKKLGFPVFVKPSNSGSSVGVNKALDEEELIKAIEEAAIFDEKILIEEAINGREVECAVLGNNKVEATTVGEIFSAEEFYSYDAKYNNSDSKTKIPADLPQEKIDEIRRLAKKAFKAVDGRGLARVDFFIDNRTQEVKICEINTMPGFTQISMYPQLWQNEGLSYSNLLSRLIELAMEK